MAVALAIALAISLGMNFSGEVSAERQPHMKSALGHLNQAAVQLKKSSHDKGGHRVKALGLVNQAIAQVKKGIVHDNQNGGKAKDAARKKKKR